MRLYDWKMKPTWSRLVLNRSLRPAPTTCRPITSTEPASAASNPDRQYSSVDLPEPLGPTIATISPAATCRLTPRSTSVARRLLPRPITNDLHTSRATTVQLIRSPLNGFRHRTAGAKRASLLSARYGDWKGLCPGDDREHAARAVRERHSAAVRGSIGTQERTALV